MADPTHLGTITRNPVPAQPSLPDRYALGSLLASGGQGLVYRALDQATGADVVVKLVPLDSTAQASRFAREAGVLRALSLPHVVRLLDSGVRGSEGWIVLEYAHGERFPAGRHTWSELRDTVVVLLDTLAQLHDHGLIHRDLKPGNVLVDAQGRPTLLDFGLVKGAPAGPSITRTGMVMGTPRYMAPEQIRGDRADPRTDLYALGLMVWEALARRIPFAGDDVSAMFDARLRMDCPPIRSQVPDLPPEVADAIDALVARQANDRPISARATLRRLAGQAVGRRYPWLGSRNALDDVCRRLARGERCGIRGPRGSGKTRFLQEVEAQLGRPTLWVGPGSAPAASLVALLGRPANDENPVGALQVQLQSRLDAGTLLVVDDADRVDAWSRRILAAVRGAVLLVDTDPASTALDPLPESALAALFAGPERLLHLRSDAARLLWRRSGGSPARLVAELDRWMAAGLADRTGEGIRLDRPAIERIDAGFLGPPPEVTGDTTLPDDLDQLLAWVHLAGPGCSVDRLASARSEPRWQVELAIEELIARGAATRLGAIVEPVRAARALQSWHSESRLAAHAALAEALPPGTPGRVAHFVALGDPERLIAEALLVSRQHVAEGRLAAAGATLREVALAALYTTHDTSALWRALAATAALDGTRGQLLPAQDLLRRAGADPTLITLIDAHVDLTSGHRELARQRVMVLGPLSDADVELMRRELLVQIARGDGGEPHAQVVAASAAWAEEIGSEEAMAARASWIASLHYQQNRSELAATEAEAGAIACPSLTRKLRLMLRAMSCWIEAGDVERASAMGAQLRAIGSSRRLPTMEAYGEWTARTLAHRLGAAGPVDQELVEAAGHLGAPEVAGVVWVTEAAIALRNDDRASASGLGRRAGAAFRESGQPASAAWARAVTAAADRSRQDAEAAARDLVATGRLDIIAEGLALLAAESGLDPRWRVHLEAARSAAHWGPREDWPRGLLAPREMVWADGPRARLPG